MSMRRKKEKTDVAVPSADFKIAVRLSDAELDRITEAMRQQASLVLKQVLETANRPTVDTEKIMERSRMLQRCSEETHKRLTEYTTKVLAVNQQYYEAMNKFMDRLETAVASTTPTTPLIDPKGGYVLVPISLSLLKSVGLQKLIDHPVRLQDRVEGVLKATALLAGGPDAEEADNAS
jgi:hypothetical protein